VLATREDPLFTTAEVERAGRILSNMYKKAHSPETFRITFHEGSHKFDREMQSEAWDWMKQWLKRG
jgi:predicted esterase